jgi:hypothetical protein
VKNARAYKILLAFWGKLTGKRLRLLLESEQPDANEEALFDVSDCEKC